MRVLVHDLESLMRTTWPRFTLHSVAAAAAACLGAPVSAQESPATQEVMVTATKRSEGLSKIPVAVSAISGEDLQERGITDVLSLDKAIPGLKIANGGNDPSAILRGAGTAGTTDIAVPFYVNGVYRPRSGQGLASYLDVERVEVLRGPQGTLFGRNTFGGLINVVSRAPDPKANDFGAALTVGDYARRKLEGFVNVSLGSQLALRVTASDEKRDPFVRNTFNPEAGLKDADNTYARAQLLFKPSSTLSFNLTATHWRDTANGNADYQYKCLGIPVNAATQKFDGVTGFVDPRCGTRTGWDGGRSQAGNIANGDGAVDPDPYKVAFDFKPQREIAEDSVSLRMDWQVANHSLAVTAARFDYRELRLTDTDVSPKPALVAGQLTHSKAESLEITLNSLASGPLRYTLGAYLFDDTQPGGNNSAFLWGYTYSSPQKPAWASWLYQGNGGTKSTALYGQASYALTDKLTAAVGLRKSKDARRSFTLNVVQSSRNDPLPSYAGSPRVNNGDDTHTDWRASVQYQLDKDTMVYASGSTGYIAGAVQAVTQTLLEPQTNETLELGAKTTLLGGRLKLNAALYKADYTGLTTTVFVTQGAAGTILAQQVPGGSTTATGLELEAKWAFNDKLNLSLALASARTEFKKFSVANNLGTAGSDFIAPNGQGWFIMDGKKTAFSPDLTLSLGASYYIDLGRNGSLVPSGWLSYSSRYRATNAPYFWSVQPAYTTLDMALTWTSADGKWSARGFVNNATNEAILTSAAVFSRGRAFADYSSPRNMGLRVAYNF
jgi:iron complex outermembrane receptor protein